MTLIQKIAKNNQLPFFVVFDQTKAPIVANFPQQREQYYKHKPNDDVEKQIFGYAFVLFNVNAIAAISVDLLTFRIDRLIGSCVCSYNCGCECEGWRRRHFA